MNFFCPAEEQVDGMGSRGRAALFLCLSVLSLVVFVVVAIDCFKLLFDP